MAEQIIKHFPDDGSPIYEPFAGSAAVPLLSGRPARLNDSCKSLIELYRHIQDGMALPEAPTDRESFFEKRTRYNELVTTNAYTEETAGLFLYLNRTAYNGVYRTNLSGKFNVPPGRGTISWPDKAEWAAFRDAISGWPLTSGDFRDGTVDEGEVVYADPPYDTAVNYYGPDEFDWDDQLALVAWLGGLKNHVVVSNRATARVIEAYEAAGFVVHECSIRYNIGQKVESRKKYPEIIAVKKAG